jgi:hypothetical protein
MSDAKKPTKKAAAKAKKAPAVEIPPNPTRGYGTTVYTTRTTSKAEAARLVGDCDFRLLQSGPGGYELYADAAAYDRLKGSK